jgi:hypothetical protein
VVVDYNVSSSSMGVFTYYVSRNCSLLPGRIGKYLPIVITQSTPNPASTVLRIWNFEPLENGAAFSEQLDIDRQRDDKATQKSDKSQKISKCVADRE